MTVAEGTPRYLVMQIWSINLSCFQSLLFCFCPWIRQLLHWLYGSPGKEELCICLLQVNCELKKPTPHALPLKNRYCKFVFILFLLQYCIGIMSFPMISLGFYIHPNIWHVCESLLKFIWVYVWLGAVSCWIAESWNNYGRKSLVLCFSTNDIVLCCIQFSSWQDYWKVSYSSCHLVTFEAISLTCFCCLIILCLLCTGNLIFSLVINSHLSTVSDRKSVV